MVFDSAVHTEDDPIASLIQLNKQMIESVKDGDTELAQQTFETFKAKWQKEEPSIKKENLSSHLETYQQAGCRDEIGILGSINGILNNLYTKLERHETVNRNNQLDQASSAIDNLITSWLAVEGDVVPQSEEAYTTSEENLKLMKAEIGSHPAKVFKQIEEIVQLIDLMTNVEGSEAV